MPLLRSESLRGKCAELHTVAASNSRDQEITLVVIISKYYQLFTSFTGIIRDHSPRSLHRDNSIIACSHHIYMSLILDTHPVRGESHIQRNANREVATPLWALSCLETESLTYLASLTHRVTWVLFRVNCIKKQAEVLPHSPIAMGGGFGGLSSSETKLPPVEIWSTIKQWCLFKFQTNAKPFYWRLSGNGSVGTRSFS